MNDYSIIWLISNSTIKFLKVKEYEREKNYENRRVCVRFIIN